MEKISWTDHTRKEVSGRVENRRTYIKRRQAIWIGHILHRKFLLKHVTGGKIEGRTVVTGGRGRRR